MWVVFIRVILLAGFLPPPPQKKKIQPIFTQFYGNMTRGSRQKSLDIDRDPESRNHVTLRLGLGCD